MGVMEGDEPNNDWQISDEDFETVRTTNDGDAWPEEWADMCEAFEGYEGLDFQMYAQRVADRIFNIHQEREVNGQFIWSLTCNADGEIDGGVVSIAIPQTGLYLTTSVEWKRMTDNREAAGRRGLLAIKAALLDYEYRNARGMFDVWGLG